ncbi:MAG: alpha-ketoacid dehydrogenase subunit beta [Chloroflexi bacterium]|nr:alpha-ketoacid dehydrogenase subunit beta [Chloroflexota bacterium]
MKEIRYVRAITEALDEEIARDEKVFLIGEDIGRGEGIFNTHRGLLAKYGDKRVKDTPISESAFMGLALGAAMAGLRPVVDILFMDFLTVCMDPLINHIAKARYMFGGQYTMPITITASTGAGLGAGPHHSQCLEAWFAHIPGLKVVMPSTPYDVKGLLKSAIRDDNPVLFLYDKTIIAVKGEIPEEEYLVPLGKADIKREGTDVTVVAVSKMVTQALMAADKLAAEGISIEVIDPRTISPLDMETIISSVKKTSKLVIVHEAVKKFGIGAEIAATVVEEAMDYLDAPIKRVGAPFTPVPISPPEEKAYIPSADQIIEAVKEIAS